MVCLRDELYANHRPLSQESGRGYWASLKGTGFKQSAEKLDLEGGGGFNPRIKPAKSARASAPEERFSPISPEMSTFSIAFLALEGRRIQTDPLPGRDRNHKEGRELR